MQDRLFTIYQVADLLGATSNQVLGWIRNGWLPSQRLPDGPVRVSEHGLIQFLKGRGIDIMQLMVSTAVKDGGRPLPRPGADAPAAEAEPTASPGEPFMLLPDDSPPEPTDEADGDEGLAVREMLTGTRPVPQEPAGGDAADDPFPPLEPPADTADEPDEADDTGLPVEGLAPEEDSAEPWDRAEDEDEGEGQGEGVPQPPRAEAPPPAEAPAEPQPQAQAPKPVEPPEPLPPAEAPAEPQPQAQAPKPVEPPEPLPPAPGRAEQVAEAILADAVARGASHVHLETSPDGPVLHVRIDGVLRPKPRFGDRLPDELAPALIEALLGWAGVAPSEAHRPRSGRFARTIDGGEVTFELSSLPTTHGPRLVLAVRDARAPAPDLAQLDLPAEAREALCGALARPDGGLVLVAGPSYAAAGPVLGAMASFVAAQGRSVLTVEADASGPLPGSCRSRVEPLEGYTFSDAAAAMLAQDADAMLVAQLRDPRTATAALEAALAGRTVLAGVRAATAGEAIDLLTEMDLEPWPLSSALSAVAAVRTVRRLCDACKQTAEVPADQAAGLGIDPAPLAGRLCRAVGCARCGGTGYAGVLRLISVLVPDEGIRRLVRSRAGVAALAAAGREGGVEALRRLAARRLADGQTTLAEVARVL